MKFEYRNYYFDNAKLILIFLVVLGHFIEPFIEYNRYAKTIFLFIYTFHMPTFIFISGYFSKVEMKDGWLLMIIKKFLIPYIICQYTFSIFTNLIGIREYPFRLIFPSYTWWFLFAMFIWNISIRFIIRLNNNIDNIIILNIIIAILSGYIDRINGTLAISRIIIFFPFFMLGYYFKINGINAKKIIKNKIISSLILISTIIILFLFEKSINSGWLWCSMPYNSLGINGIIAAIMRITVYIFQLITMFSVLSIIPSKEYKITSIGSNTMPIYVIHSFIVKVVLAIGFYNNISFIKITILILFSIVIVYLIGSKFVLNSKYKKQAIYR